MGFGSVNITYGWELNWREADDLNGLAPWEMWVSCRGRSLTLLLNGQIDTGSGPVILTGETGPSYTVTSPGTYCVTTS
jgi:hypothetical protein